MYTLPCPSPSNEAYGRTRGNEAQVNEFAPAGVTVGKDNCEHHPPYGFRIESRWFSDVCTMGSRTSDGRVPLTSLGPPPRPACGCDCGSDDSIANEAPDDVCRFQCHCTCCGPGPNSTRRCAEYLCLVAIAMTQSMRGRTIPDASNADALLRTPVFCGDCQEHQLLALRQEAVKSARKKRIQEQSKTARSRSRGRDDRPALHN